MEAPASNLYLAEIGFDPQHLDACRGERTSPAADLPNKGNFFYA